jgi:hypothetical protein
VIQLRAETCPIWGANHMNHDLLPDSRQEFMRLA